MHRSSPGFLLVFALPMLMALAGCAGKGSNVPGNDTVQSVTLSPNADNISLDLGSTSQTFTGTAKNGIGQVVPIQVSFVSSNNAALTIAKDGQACAGTWDSLSNPVVCHPGVVGVALVTATVGGISSSPSTVYVHQHIDNIVVSPISPPQTDCLSLNDPNPQFRAEIYQATAYSNGVDITNSVGPISFTTTEPNVVTLDFNKQLPINQVQVTAKDPGITDLIASVGGATSNPSLFKTCLVSAVLLQAQNNQTNSINFTNGGSATLEATVFDTHGNNVSNPPLTWGSTHPEVASVTATTTNGTNTVTAKTNLGGTDVFAACAPPSCNIGVLPGMSIYSTGGMLLNGKPDPNPQDPAGKPAFGEIAVNVTNSKVETYTAWATTTGCNNALNCGSGIFSLTTSNTNPITAITTLPYTPNSFLTTPDGGTGYLGSNLGLMIVSLNANPTVTTASSQTSPCTIALCGKVLTVSPDSSKRAVISDTISKPNQVYIYTGANSAPIDLTVPGATAATFSPDGQKLFILTNTGTMYVYSTVDALAQVPGVQSSATDVSFSPDGSFGYVAGNPASSVSAFATCGLQNLGALQGTLTGNPLRLFPIPNTGGKEQLELAPGNYPGGQVVPASTIKQDLVAVAPPNVQFLSATFTRDPILGLQQSCNPSQLTLTPGAAYNVGQGNFTPLYMELAGSGGQFGAQVVIVAQNIPAVLVFDTNGKTTTAFPLVNNAFPLSASASTDGSQIFVGACDAFQDNDPTKPCTAASVHIVNTLSGGDIQQTPFDNPNTKNSMCTGIPDYCVPDMVAIQPK